MSIRQEYEAYLQRQVTMGQQFGEEADPFFNRYAGYVEPFRIYGNLYYIGDDWVCAYLIDTGEGLLLLDAGNFGSEGMLIDAIWRLGFDPKNIRWIILSHGHMDHFGAVGLLKRLSNPELLLGEPDAKMFLERPELSFLHHSMDIAGKLFTPDRLIRDGDVIRFGNTEVKFYMAPGHTEGTIACFFEAEENGIKKRVGYFGGFGLNTLQKDYLLEIGDTSYSMRQKHIDSLARVRDEKVDIFIPNHTFNVDIVGHRKRMLEEGVNPFLDDTVWAKYMDQRIEIIKRMMEDPGCN